MSVNDLIASDSNAKTTGQHLQQWLIHEGIGVSDPVFPDAVDLAVRNALRKARKQWNAEQNPGNASGGTAGAGGGGWREPR